MASSSVGPSASASPSPNSSSEYDISISAIGSNIRSESTRKCKLTLIEKKTGPFSIRYAQKCIPAHRKRDKMKHDKYDCFLMTDRKWNSIFRISGKKNKEKYIHHHSQFESRCSWSHNGIYYFKNIWFLYNIYFEFLPLYAKKRDFFCLN